MSARPRLSRPRRRFAWRTWISVAVVLAMSAFFAAKLEAQDTTRRHAARVAVESDGFRFEFDALTGNERLLRVEDGVPQGPNLVNELPEEAARMRIELCREFGIDALDDLVREHRLEADTLRRLGYL